MKNGVNSTFGQGGFNKLRVRELPIDWCSILMFGVH